MTVNLSGFAFDSTGAAISGATINIYARNTTTPVVTTTTTNASGYWTRAAVAEGRYDVEIVNGTTYRRMMYDDEVQLERGEFKNLLIRGSDNAFPLTFVLGAITAARNLTIPTLAANDTIAVLAAAQTFSGANTFSATQNFLDDTLLTFGTGGDIALVNRSSILGANTALTSVIIGTPVTPAIAADSLILSNTTASGDILVAGNLSGNSRAYLFVDVSADTADLMTAGVSRIRLGSAGLVAINDTSNAVNAVGLTINQGANDNEILSLKSSDVAHGVTSFTETDTYGTLLKFSATAGGLYVAGLSEDNTAGVAVRGVWTTDNTTKSTAGLAAIRLIASKKSGTSAGGLGANANLLTIEDGTVGAEFIFSIDQGAYEDIGTAWTNYDADDDLSLVNSLAAHAARPGNEIGLEFAAWATVNRERLETLDILHWDKTGKGRHFLNMTKHQMLLNGAIRQLGLKLSQVEAQLALANGR